LTVSDFFPYLKPGKRAHLVGIGGVSMSPLAEVFKLRGLTVQGSDITDSEVVQGLRSDGISVFIGHRPENVAGADFVVRTAAVHDDNPEIRAAREAGIPVFERTQAWGAIMKDYACGVCVAGTHGKTTTTSMLTHILMEAGKDPTVMIGGTLPLIGSGYRVGRGDTILLESCEYYDSFLNFSPTVAVILNVDNDHLDYFGTLENIKKSFRAFAELTPEKEGWVISCADDRNTEDTLAGIARQRLRYGFAPDADMRPMNLTEGRISEFDAVFRGETWAHISLRIGGRHNILNALAACAAAKALGLDPKAVEKGLGAFRGAGRRAEFKGKCGEADVYDDYAHHPSEFRALMDAVSKMGYQRIVVAFQPHTYSRLKNLFEDFVQVLSIPDKLYLADVYAAREKDVFGVSSADLAARIPGAVYCRSFGELCDALRAELRAGDMLLTVGAGDIYKVGEMLLDRQA
jgi:UDP-N-acetylmuramate--alanine ligase